MSKTGYTFYPKDWQTSDKVFQLSLEERAIYREIIDLSYLNDNKICMEIDIWARKWNTKPRVISKGIDKLLSINLITLEDGIIAVPSSEPRLSLIRGGRKGGINSKPTPKPSAKPTPKGEANQKKIKENKEKENKGQKAYRAFAHLSLSFSDFQALLDLGYSKEQIDNTLDAVENYSGNTKYRNLMTTCRNWLQKDAKPKARTLIETMPTDPDELKAWQADNRRRILGQYEATMGQLEQSIKDEADD